MDLIDTKGVPAWGRLPSLPGHINWQLYDARNAMGAKRMAWQRRFLFKHFDFYGALGQGFTFGCGMVRLGLLNSTFAYLHTAKGLHRIQFDLPLDLGFQSDYKPIGQSSWVHPWKKITRFLRYVPKDRAPLNSGLVTHFMGKCQLIALNLKPLP
jgi:hypothetical protein